MGVLDAWVPFQLLEGTGFWLVKAGRCCKAELLLCFPALRGDGGLIGYSTCAGNPDTWVVSQLWQVIGVWLLRTGMGGGNRIAWGARTELRGE